MSTPLKEGNVKPRVMQRIADDIRAVASQFQVHYGNEDVRHADWAMALWRLAREAEENEQALASSLSEERTKTQAANDWGVDGWTLVNLIADALKVPYEPHQTVQERLLARAGEVGVYAVNLTKYAKIALDCLRAMQQADHEDGKPWRNSTYLHAMDYLDSALAENPAPQPPVSGAQSENGLSPAAPFKQAVGGAGPGCEYEIFRVGVGPQQHFRNGILAAIAVVQDFNDTSEVGDILNTVIAALQKDVEEIDLALGTPST